MAKSRLRDLGLQIGHMPAGPKNHIVDVPEIWVGHCAKIENAVLNALCAGETLSCFENRTVHQLPHELIKKHCFK